MPVVTAYQCPWTRRLFTDKEKYSDHLSRYREGVILPDARRRHAAKKAQDVCYLKSFDAIIEWVESNSQVLFDTIAEGPFKSTAKNLNRFVESRENFFVKITELSIRHNKQVSNSHNCPYTGVTNWNRRETFKDGTPKPLGYPGWRGRIEFVMPETHLSASSIFHAAKIKTGTGGGCASASGKNKHALMKYGYDVIFFEDDFPGLSEFQTLCRLKQVEPNFSYSYHFNPE